MKTKTIIPIMLFTIFLAMLSTFLIMASSTNAQNDMALPPTATPGASPVDKPAYQDNGGKVVTDQEKAIQHALAFDAIYAVRQRALSEEMFAANPDMISVEYYATRQEASNAYDTGVFVDPIDAKEPVWVVIIRGKATINDPIYRGEKETDGVTYMISEVTGDILLHADGILPKVK
jgi:hypothetical protein